MEDSNKFTKGPIQRKGTFLWQEDSPSGAGINLWSASLHPNNGYPPEHAERAAMLFEAAPDLYDAADNALNALLACCVPAGGVDDRKTILEAQAMLRAAISKATGA